VCGLAGAGGVGRVAGLAGSIHINLTMIFLFHVFLFSYFIISKHASAMTSSAINFFDEWNRAE
jgi:hypothetical protein